MNKTLFASVMMLGCTLIIASAADKAPSGLTKSDSPDKYNLQYDGVPIRDVIADIVRQTNVNIVASPDSLKAQVTCNFSDVPLLPALAALVGNLGLVFREQVQGSGVYSIRHATPEEQRAAMLRRFFVALIKEGFSEDQAMRILLHDQDEDD